jgi:uncharacterized membrane protein
VTASSHDRDLGKARVEALSDGVFAIAMTLLVLDLRLPDLPPHPTSAQLGRAVATLGPAFFGFGITFVLTGTFWFLHHVTFHNTKCVTKGICAINVLFLMFVSLLPFSTGVLARSGPTQPVALTVYFGNQLALGAVLNLHWIVATERGLVVQPVANPRERMMILFQPLSCVLALIVTPVAPALSYYAYRLGLLGGRLLARRRYRGLPADAPAPL